MKENKTIKASEIIMDRINRKVDPINGSEIREDAEVVVYHPNENESIETFVNKEHIK